MKLTLLHLSDVQFGQHHRFESDEGFETLYRRLTDDLDALACRPDLVVVTGDLAEWGLRSEFDQALDFLEKLTGHLGVPRGRVAVIPGNHDVNRKLCEAYFVTCAGEEEEPAAPYWPKWRPYVRFFHAFYRDVSGVELTEEEPWTLFAVPELEVVVAGLNSTMAESHRKEDHYGLVGERQLRWFEERLREYRERGWLCLGAVHHNVVRGASGDDANLRDAGDFERVLGSSLDLVLHGHTHESKLQWLRESVPIVALGSSGVSPADRPPEVPNQYHVLEIGGGGFVRRARCYVPGQKRWVGDTSISEDGDRWEVETALAVRDHPGRTREERIDFEAHEPVHDDLLARVEDVCRLREGADAGIRRVSGPPDYLRVTQREGPIVRSYPLAAVDELTGDAFDAFLGVHRRYRHSDSGVVSVLVHGAVPPPDEVVRRARDERVRLQSFVEYQGLIDFRAYLERQTRVLANDTVYVPESYVEQGLRYTIGQEEHEDDDAFATVRSWLFDDRGRFVLVLGDFGTGKTFLLRELARRLGEQDVPVVPILIELRALEKAVSLDVLVAQHLVASGMDAQPEKFRYMLREGRVALLFDGFDELALRVSYDRAVEHFSTLTAAAGGNAKVVVTSRTQHFESDRQVRTSLGEKVELFVGSRIVDLQGFDEGRIRRFLVRQLGDETSADERFTLLGEVRDLMGLSENPRMLGFISELGEGELLAARSASGEVTAASLYEALLKRWLGFEVERLEPRGAPLALTEEQRWDAVTHLAMCLWGRSESSISVRELPDEVGKAVEMLAEQKMSLDEATHQVGSGTLLVRDDEGRFSFIHRSVLEWLVAKNAARELAETGEPTSLGVRKISPLLAEFFRDLAGRERATRWVEEALRTADETVRDSAVAVLDRLKAVRLRLRENLYLVGKDLRGHDFSGDDLDGVDFTGADLTSARLVGSSLRDVRLEGVQLVDADLSRSDLRGARLGRTDLSRARLLGADLRGADLAQSVLWRTKLVGARLDRGVLAEARSFGAVLPGENLQPWHSSWPSRLHSVAWYPGREILASGHADGSLRLWDAASGQEIRCFLGHALAVTSVCFSPDGSRLASGSFDNTVQLWAVGTGKETARLGGHQRYVTSVCFSPDGSRLASGSDDKTVRLWDVGSGKETARLDGHQRSVTSVCFSPDGSRLASGSDDKTVRLWDVGSGKETARLDGHQKYVRSVCFSPDGSRLASGSDDNTVRLWDVGSGEETARLDGHQKCVTSVYFSPGGSRLASGSFDKMVRLWDVKSGKETARLDGHQRSVRSVCFSPDGSRLASGSFDNTVRLWDVGTGKETARLGGNQRLVMSVCFSPDGSRLASGSFDNTVRLWDVGSGKETARLDGHQRSVTSVWFSPDGTRLASGSGDNTVRLWGVESGKETARLDGHQRSVFSVCFSPDGSRLASGSFDDTVRLWDVGSGKETARLYGHLSYVRSVCFSPDGSRLASGSDDKTVRLWDVGSGKETARLDGHQGYVWSVCFSPGGSRLASSSYDNTVRLWDVGSGQQTARLYGHQSYVRSVCFSPDGSHLASASEDNTVRLWDVESGKETARLDGHQSSVNSVCFSPDGSRLASGSYDNTVRLWDFASGRCLAVLVHLAEGWAAYTPEGRYRLGGETSGGFWHSIGLCRFEPGELDPYLDEPLRLGAGEALF